MLHLSSRGLFGKIKHAATGGPGKSVALAAASTAVGLAMGRACQTDAPGPVVKTICKHGSALSLGAGVALTMVGLPALGDGVAAAGATLLGYRFGARRERRRQLVAATTPQRR